jgi:hypothetical protein
VLLLYLPRLLLLCSVLTPLVLCVCVCACVRGVSSRWLCNGATQPQAQLQFRAKTASFVALSPFALVQADMKCFQSTSGVRFAWATVEVTDVDGERPPPPPPHRTQSQPSTMH